MLKLYFNREFKINHLRVFGTEVYVHMPKQQRRKWDPKSKSGIFVGYANSTKAYRVWFPGTNKVNIFRGIVFKGETGTTVAIPVSDIRSTKPEMIFQDTKSESQDEPKQGITLRDRATLRKPDRYVAHSFISSCKVIESITYEEAKSSIDEKNNWTF